MVNPEYASHLRKKASGLPLTPGVYIMKDKAGKVIYVGKSRKLKNRVSQYFHENDFSSPRTDAMTFFVADFDYILCDTEIEALSLENTPQAEVQRKPVTELPRQSFLSGERSST